MEIIKVGSSVVPMAGGEKEDSRDRARDRDRYIDIREETDRY